MKYNLIALFFLVASFGSLSAQTLVGQQTIEGVIYDLYIWNGDSVRVVANLPVDDDSALQDSIDAVANIVANLPVDDDSALQDSIDAVANIVANLPVDDDSTLQDSIDAVANIVANLPVDDDTALQDSIDAVAALVSIIPVDDDSALQDSIDALGNIIANLPVDDDSALQDSIDALGNIIANLPVDDDSALQDSIDALGNIIANLPVDDDSALQDSIDAVAALVSNLPVDDDSALQDSIDAVATMVAAIPIDDDSALQDSIDAVAALVSNIPIDDDSALQDSIDAVAALVSNIPIDDDSALQDSIDAVAALVSAIPVDDDSALQDSIDAVAIIAKYITSENYQFNIDQDTSGLDGQILTFNSATGEIELMPFAEPQDVTNSYYLETIPAEVNASLSTATSDLGAYVAGARGSSKLYLFNVAQLAGAGDAGGGLDSNYPSGTYLDADGVPFLDGEFAVSAPTTITVSEAGATGAFYLWDQAIFVPSVWAGDKVGSIRIQDSNTLTNQSDRDEIWVGLKDGTTEPSLDRTDLVKVAEAQVGVSFTTPATWVNRWFRMNVIHTDLGGASQMNLSVDIFAPDGSVIASNVAIRNFMWGVDNLGSLPLFPSTQRIIKRTFTASTGVEEWTDGDGNLVNPNELNQALIMVNQDYLPIDFTATTINGSTTIENAALGDGGPYQYSFDGGATYQSSNVFVHGSTLTGADRDVWQILPTVKDGTSNSIIETPVVSVTDPTNQSSNINIAGSESNATSFGMGSSGGWEIEYSTLLVDKLEESDINSNWVLNNATTDANYLYIANGSTNVSGSAETPLDEFLPVAENGQVYTLNYDITNTSFGAANSTTTIVVEAIDQVSGVVLAVNSYTNSGNTSSSALQERLNFTGAGNAVKIKVSVSNDGGSDVASNNIRFDDMQLFEGEFSNTATRFQRVTTQAYLTVDGINTTSLDGGYATLTTAVEDVSESDVIRLTGDIRKAGTLEDTDNKMQLMYRLDGGAWVMAFEELGQFDVAGETAYSDFYTGGIDVSNASTIELQMRFFSGGEDTVEGWFVYDLGFEEVHP